MRRSRPPNPPTPAVTVTIPGNLRQWVADALLEQIRFTQEADERTRGARRRIPPHRQIVATGLRDLYEEIVP